MMGPSAFTAARSLRRDQSVKSAKIAKGTTRRILSFVRPYRRLLVVFLAFVVVDAVVSADVDPYSPALQLTHTLAPAKLYCPTGHCPLHNGVVIPVPLP